MKKYFGLIFVIILGILPLIPLLSSGLPVTHDGQDHVARIANFYQSLSEGNIIPRWAGNLNWGYGHPILMFLYPLPSYLASFFHVLGASLVDSVKLVFATTYILSGVGMYIWIKNLWGKKEGIVAAAIYMYAPYRFVDLYVRGAIGEHVAFVFIPFACYFLMKLSRKYSYANFLGLSISTAGLILAHNAMALMFFPIIFFYFLTLITKRNYSFIFSAITSSIIGVGLSFFFIFPAFFEGKYTLRDKVTGSFEYRSSFVPIQRFFEMSWSFGGTSQLSKQIGVSILFSFMASLFQVFQKKNQRALFVLFGGSLLVSLFMMTSYSDIFWTQISIIQKFQFPWRFLSVVVFSGSVLGGMAIYELRKSRYQYLFFLILVFSSIIFSIPYIRVNNYLRYPDSYYTKIYDGTTDTGESAPIWSVRFMERIANSPVEIIEGDAEILNYEKNTIMRKYTIQASEPSRIRENTLYFPNWEVFVNSKKMKIEYQDELNRGLITYFIPKGTSHVEVIFSDTKLRLFANYVSIISFISLIFIGVRFAMMTRRKK